MLGARVARPGRAASRRRRAVRRRRGRAPRARRGAGADPAPHRPALARAATRIPLPRLGTGRPDDSRADPTDARRDGVRRPAGGVRLERSRLGALLRGAPQGRRLPRHAERVDRGGRSALPAVVPLLAQRGGRVRGSLRQRLAVRHPAGRLSFPAVALRHGLRAPGVAGRRGSCRQDRGRGDRLPLRRSGVPDRIRGVGGHDVPARETRLGRVSRAARARRR